MVVVVVVAVVVVAARGVGEAWAPDVVAVRQPVREGIAFARLAGIASRTCLGYPAPVGFAPNAERG